MISFQLRRKNGRRALTLVELLAGIAIIAILAAILLTALSFVRKQQSNTICTSNLRQIGVGFSMYTTDNDLWMPDPADPVNYGNWWGATWKAKIATYVDDPSIFICPERPTNPNNPDATEPPEWTGTYGINAFIGEQSQWDKRKANTIENPAMTILVGENGDGDWVCEPIGGPWGAPGTHVPLHSGRGNFLFVDGRVESLTVEESHRDNFYLWRVVKVP